MHLLVSDPGPNPCPIPPLPVPHQAHDNASPTAATIAVTISAVASTVSPSSKLEIVGKISLTGSTSKTILQGKLVGREC